MAAPERIGLAMNLHYTAAKVPLASLICPDISLDPKKAGQLMPSGFSFI
ncbi:MAG: hypothetical protein ACYC1A_00260 [Spirochaetales bacterium]